MGKIKQEQQRRELSRRDIRSLAFHLVYAVDRSDYIFSLHEIVDSFRSGFNLDIPEDSFAVTLAQGAIENRDSLDELIRPMLKNWKLERLGCCTHLILRIALWELQQPQALSSVIINEAVELAKAFAEKDAYKFVNGVLDTISKQSHREEEVVFSVARK